MFDLHRRLFRRLLAAWLGVSLLLSGGALVYDLVSIDAEIQRQAGSRLDEFTLADLAAQPRLESRALDYARRHYIHVELFDPAGKRLDSATNPDHETLEQALAPRRQRFPLVDALHYEKIVLGNISVVHVQGPVRDSDGRLAGYVDGSFFVDPAAVAQLRREAVAALVVGSVVDGRVVKIAEKDSTKNPGEKFAFGAYVDLGGVSGLLHNREMADPVKEGDTVKVFVISAEMDGDKPRVALSTTKVAEQEQAEELLSFFGAGDRTTGRDIRAANIDGVEGFTMKIGQVATDAFLPASDANVKDTSVLTKGSRVARVVCTGKVFAGKYVQVTREDV